MATPEDGGDPPSVPSGSPASDVRLIGQVIVKCIQLFLPGGSFTLSCTLRTGTSIAAPARCISCHVN